MSVKTTWKKNDLPKLQQSLKELKGMSVAIGVNESDAKKKKDGSDGLTVVEVATFHEFGTVNIPERSFIRSNDAKNKDKYKKIKVGIANKINQLKISPAQGLGLLGEAVLLDMKKGIVDGIEPALDPKTIAAKGSSTPLIDTSQMLNSLTYKVGK